MAQGINLTPPQEIKRRRTQYVVGASTKISVFLLVVALGVAGYYYSQRSSLANKVATLQSQKGQLTAQVESMREIENYAKKLSGKYFLLQKYLEGRIKYSSVMAELLARVPQEISFASLTFDGLGKRTTITGESEDIISVSSFVNRLAKEGNASSQSAVDLAGKNAFTNVRLDSLNVDEEKENQKGIQYTVSFDINEEAFLK